MDQGGLWGLKIPSRNIRIREAKRMMYWYNNTLECIISVLYEIKQPSTVWRKF